MKDYKESFWHTDDGTSISSIIHQQKRGYGFGKFNQLQKQFDIKFIRNNNNVILFELDGKEFYYAVVKQKIRLKGEKDWHSKIATYLKNEFGLSAKKFDKTVDIINFGKYSGKSFDELYKEDNSYFQWLYATTKSKYVKEKLQGVIDRNVN